MTTPHSRLKGFGCSCPSRGPRCNWPRATGYKKKSIALRIQDDAVQNMDVQTMGPNEKRQERTSVPCHSEAAIRSCRSHPPALMQSLHNKAEKSMGMSVNTPSSSNGAARGSFPVIAHQVLHHATRTNLFLGSISGSLSHLFVQSRGRPLQSAIAPAQRHSYYPHPGVMRSAALLQLLIILDNGSRRHPRPSILAMPATLRPTLQLRASDPPSSLRGRTIFLSHRALRAFVPLSCIG